MPFTDMAPSCLVVCLLAITVSLSNQQQLLTAPEPSSSNAITSCNYQLDLVVAIDASNSMFEKNFNIQKNALVNLVDSLHVTEMDINVGLVLFSSEAGSHRLSGNKQQVIQNVQSLQYLGEGTRTDLAINEAFNLFEGGRGGDVPKLLIIVTDGRSTKPQLARAAANHAKASGITIYAVGVTDAIKEEELRQFVSSPQYVLHSTRFPNLREDLLKAANRACTTIATHRPQQTTVTKACYKLDIVIAIDGSNSMFERNFNTQRSALINLVNNLHITPDDINVGLVLFSGDIKSYGLSGNKQQIIYEMNSFQYPDDSTRTDLAINEATKLFQHARGGVIKKLLIIVTDGRATYPQQALQAAQNAKASGITIYAIGETDAINREELRSLATSPQQVLFTADFQSLQNDLIQAATIACQVATTQPQQTPTQGYFTPATTPTQPPPTPAYFTTVRQPTPSACYQLDIVIAIDGSNSMFEINFNRERQALVTLLNTLHITPDDINVGLVLFSGDVQSFGLNGNKQEIIYNLNSFHYPDDATRTDLAINEAASLFQHARGGYVKKLLIIVTDGRATYSQQALQAAQNAKASGITIYSVGVTDAINQQELADFASSPQQVFFSHDFQTLRNDLMQATYKACQSVAPPVVTVPSCYQLDIVMAIDGSNSMFETNFNRERQALVNLISNLHISPNDINVGLVLFSGDVQFHPLSGDKQQIINDLNSFQYPDDATRTDLAINEAFTLFKTARGGSVKKLLIIVTDGRATYPTQALQAAQSAKSAGITIYSVGVTDAINQIELRSLASSPQQIFFSADFLSLQNDLMQATDRACQSVSVTTPTPTITACYQLDLVIAIDGSNSMFERNYNTERHAVANLINNLHVSPNDINVGLVLFSGDVKSFPLNGNKQKIISDLNSFQYPDDSTRTDLAINEATRLFRNARGGNVKKLLMIVTDGRATYPQQALQAAQNAKAAGITIYAVGETDAINQQELRSLATSPQLVFFSHDFQSIQNDLLQAAYRACQYAYTSANGIQQLPHNVIIDKSYLQ